MRLHVLLGAIALGAAAMVFSAETGSAQPAPGEIGVYLDAAGTQTALCTSFSGTFDLFVVVNIPTGSDVAAFEFQFDLDSRAFVTGPEVLPPGWVNLIGNGHYMAGGPNCLSGGGLVTLLQVNVITLETATTIPPFIFTLGTPAYSSFTSPSPGYAKCDAVLTPASLRPLAIASSTVEVSYTGQCQLACAESWIGPTGSDFASASGWSGGVYPLAERAVLSNSSAVANDAVVVAGTTQTVCGVTVSGPGAEQRLTISTASALNAANGVDIESGGFLELQSGSVQGMTTVSSGGRVEGPGTISDLDNGGTVLVNSSATLTIANSVVNTGLFELNVATVTLPVGIDFINSGVFTAKTLATIVGGVTNRNGGLFDVAATIATISGCFDNQSGATLQVRLGSNLFINGCGSITNSGTVIVNGFCPACKSASVLTLIEMDGGLLSDAGSSLQLADATLRLGGDLQIAINDPTRVSLEMATLEMRPTGDGSFSRIEMYSRDLGATEPIASTSIETVAQLSLSDTSSRVQLVDGFDNDGTPAGEVLYVASLSMSPGSTLDLAGQRLYYLQATPPDPSGPGSGVNVVDSVGGGALIAMQTSTGSDPAPISSGQLFRLSNHPNPFNPQTTIEWQMTRAGRVQVSLFNERGQRVRVLLDAERAAGTNQVQWDGRDDSGNEVSSGSYVYRIISRGETRQGKVALLR